jgi:two-component system phosphate regulon sensor histidine kinase PhoR
LTDPVDIEGPDEVGRLGEAFERMRTRVRSQVDELSILLDASRSVAGSLKLEECLPPILDGALSVTDAVGARLLLKSFNGGTSNMQTYSAGIASIEMSVIDDSIFDLVENDSQIIAIENVSRARAVLDTRSGKYPLQAIIALPVQHETSLIGVLWLGYTTPHIFSRSESDLLMTLAGQAAVAVANSRLFEASEGGRQQLDAILTATPDAIIVTDPKLRLVLVNRAAEDIFELKDKEIAGRRINEIIHQPQLAVALHSSDERTSSHEIKLRDGRTFSGSTSSILRQDGSIIGRLAVLRDVTEFKELDQQKTDAIESVSSDLKGPLALMQGYSTMLPLVGKLNNRQSEFAGKIAAGVEQMSTLIEDVLDLHRIESAVGSNVQELDMGDIVQNQTEEIKPVAVSRGIQLVCSVETGIELISGDKSMLSRATRHLLDNSLKYTPSGGTVQVNVQMRESELEISVADSGVGISRADQDRLFEKFYRVHGQQDKDSVGSGLGLSFVKSIIELHDGRVWLESQLGQGSTFYFALPVQNK